VSLSFRQQEVTPSRLMKLGALGRVVLQKVSADVRECYQHADECRRWAEQAFTPKDRTDFLEMEARWLSLARNYEFAEQLSGFTRGHRRSPRQEGKRAR
jgi:hypothetical protein